MVKLELKDRVEDGLLDLSMSQLEEVPLKDIIPFKRKVRKLDLSNNQLTSLQPTFSSHMVLLVELDLSKNQVTEIPDNFGLLVNLMHLDLYSNKIERLPLSFKELTKLRWLDLKDNPLTPQLAKIAGPCVDQSDCQKCARDVVLVMQEISRSIEADKQRKTEERQQGAPKEKKKKKKGNKGAGATVDGSGRSQLNGANQNSASAKLLDQSANRGEEKVKTSVITNRKAGSNARTTSALPVRLCCLLTRAFVWSLIFVALFIGVLYVLSLPQSRPYVATLTQQYEQVRTRTLVVAGDLPAHLNATMELAREYAGNIASWSQDFITNKLPVHAENFKVLVIELYNKFKSQTSKWINSKKD